MFEKIGKFASKYRYIIILAWITTLVLLTILAPDLSEVSTSDQSGFLPDNAPSIVAADIVREYFPDQTSPSQAVLVFESEDGSVHDEAVQSYLSNLSEWLENDLDSDIIGKVLSPSDPNLTDRLVNKDGQVAIIYVGLNGMLGDPAIDEALEAMQERLGEAPEGLNAYLTGSAAITNDYRENVKASVESTTLLTIILVMVVLLIVYRSPVSPLVPLVTIGLAYGISRALVAGLASYGFVVSSITDIFLIVLLFGAGTDYCLFIVSRFREFMADDVPGPTSARQTVSRVGETITSSAATVIVGFVAMSFVDLKIFANAGPSLAIGIFIALLACLTFTPALLAVLGRWAFWPGKPRHAEEDGFWGKLANWVTAKPWVPLILAITILVPLAVYGFGQERAFDLLSDIPDEASSKIGFTILSENFGAGEMQPLDVIITDVSDIRSSEGLAEIHSLTQDLLAVEGVADVRSLTLPAGQGSPELSDVLRVDFQLRLMADRIDDLGMDTGDPMTSSNLDIKEIEDGFNILHTYLDDLAAAFPDLVLDPEYQLVLNILDTLETNIEAATSQMLVSTQLTKVSEGISAAIANVSDSDQIESAEGMFDQLSILQAYLIGLADAIPAIAELDGYEESLSALNAIETTMVELSQGMYVSVQLNMIAGQMDQMADALASDPMALMPKPGEPSPAEQMISMRMYLEELGKEYPTLAVTGDYQLAIGMLRQMEMAFGTIDPSQVSQLISNAQQAIPLLSDAFAGLSTSVAETMPEAIFIPQLPLPGAEGGLTLIEEHLANLDDALKNLETATAVNLPDATYIPPGDMLSSGETQAAVDVLLVEVDAFQRALYSLADNFESRGDNLLIPLGIVVGEELKGLSQLLDTYTTPNGDAYRLQVVLADEPFSQEAVDTTVRMKDTIADTSQGYISGGTATIVDLTDFLDSDFILVVVLVMIGIAIVLVFLLRSLVAPVYLLGTILLSYGATMGLIRLVFGSILHTDLTWFVPFFAFVLLVALGMDYNIFLMGRVKEEVAVHGTREGIKRGLQRTGGIITSAGIIMAGTFAAMMSSSLLGLKQIAFAITIGVLLDTFVIRTTLVPAIAVLLGKWNWWPGKEPGK